MSFVSCASIDQPALFLADSKDVVGDSTKKSQQLWHKQFSITVEEYSLVIENPINQLTQPSLDILIPDFPVPRCSRDVVD